MAETYWVVEWQHSGGDAGDEYGPVAAILAGDLPPGRVAEIVQALHDARVLTQEEILHLATNPGEPPYRAELHQTRHGLAVNCGANPYLEAFRRKNLRLAGDRIVGDFAE